MELGELQPGQRVVGLVGSGWVELLSVTPRGAGAREVAYRTQAGTYDGRILYADDAAECRLADTSHRFDADVQDFKLAAECLRILNAAKYDDYVSLATSSVRPLPHQLQAVYGELLPRVPLRFLLADDPGAGKTVMAGLYIKQLMLRDDVERCLVVAPGGLVEQWQDELGEKFGLEYPILTNELVAAQRTGSVFDAHPCLIARMDHLARNDLLRAQLREARFDLVVVDEAHRMSAHVFGRETKTSLRYQLGEELRDRTRHLLLMTATPHAGKQEDFELFLSLLDPDTFAGHGRPGGARVDTSAYMRRMVKEDLVTMEGRPLFPKRVASTVEFTLSSAEQDLYEHVSDYVRTEMNRAQRLEERRSNTVGFALTVLQRRLASSPEAIYQSLRRRTERLRQHRDDLVHGRQPQLVVGPVDADEEESYPSSEYEDAATEVADSATSARTVAELDAELRALDELVALARRVRDTQPDVKWQQLRTLIERETLQTGGRRRKLIIFTEHRDTLEYLRQQLTTLLGDPEAVLAIHGGVSRVERRRVTAEFTHNERAQFLIATDAAGEGLNLQAAHLMVNYDLPWNPNRIEQRFGRVHRIGQRDVCQLWNLVARDTREGTVYLTLLRKLEEMSKAYEGKIFDVLGEAFADGTSLQELLLKAIRHGDDPAVRAEMERTIDTQAGEGIRRLLEEHDLEHDHLQADEIEHYRLRTAEAEARKLQPLFIHDAFRAAYVRLGGRWSRLGDLAYEIKHVPQRFRRSQRAIATRYDRVTFLPDDTGDVGAPSLLAPGHPLLDEVLAQAATECGPALEAGARLVSPDVTEPTLLVGIAQECVDGLDEVIDRQFQYLFVDAGGDVRWAGHVPYLDLEACPPEVARQPVPGWVADAERVAVDHVATVTLPTRIDELRPARERRLERTQRTVHERLTHEVSRLSSAALEAAIAEQRGEAVQPSSAQLGRLSAELRDRRDRRLEDIAAQRRLSARAPQVVSRALVFPTRGAVASHAVDTRVSERRAVDRVLAVERALGRTPHEQPHNNEGFDVTSLAPDGTAVTIEVKGRVRGARDFVITRSEVITSKNAQPHYRLALVALDPDDPARDEVVYVGDPFSEVTFGDYTRGSMELSWDEAWRKGMTPW